jgi:hypothetical protein
VAARKTSKKKTSKKVTRRPAPEPESEDELEPGPLASDDPFEAMEDEEFEAPLDSINENDPEYDAVYEAVCVDVVKNTGKTSGMAKFQFTFRVTADEDGEDVECEGWEDDVHCSLSKAALWKLGEVLEAMTIAKPGERVTFKRSDVIGRQVMVSIEKNEYQGRERPRIGAVGVFEKDPGSVIDVQEGDTPF